MYKSLHLASHMTIDPPMLLSLGQPCVYVPSSTISQSIHYTSSTLCKLNHDLFMCHI